MAFYKCAGENPTGNATPADVLATKTFSNEADGTDQVGTMTNRGAVSVTLDTSTKSYTVPAGYHNGSGTVSITTQERSASASTSDQNITPDSGKVLSKVAISKITPQNTAGTAAVASGQDSTGPYVYFPYGWYPSGGNDRQYIRMTAAQAIAACPSETKTVTSSRSAQTVTPTSGKLMSKVTVNALAPTGTYTASSRGASLDMGATSNYRYVNTNSVPNSNSGTYTFASGDTGGTKDLGTTNTYRYVNAANVYAKGKSDGKGIETTVNRSNFVYVTPYTTYDYKFIKLSNVITSGKPTTVHIEVNHSESISNNRYQYAIYATGASAYYLYGSWLFYNAGTTAYIEVYLSEDYKTYNNSKTDLIVLVPYSLEPKITSIKTYVVDWSTI